MNQTDARNFIAALNAAQPYIPPMIFQPLVSNPMIKVIESIANGEMFKPLEVKEAG